MGIITQLLVDGIVVSTLFAGVRRTTGWSVYNFLEPKIEHTVGRLALKTYLNAGEWCVDKGKLVLEKLTVSGNMPKKSVVEEGFNKPRDNDKL